MKMSDPNIIKEILFKVPVDKYPSVCQTDKLYQQICNDESFWRERFSQDGLILMKPQNTVGEYIKEYQISQTSLELAYMYYDYLINNMVLDYQATGLAIFDSVIRDIQDFIPNGMSSEHKEKIYHDFQEAKHISYVQKKETHPIISNYVYDNDFFRYPWQNIGPHLANALRNWPIEVGIFYLYPGEFFLTTQITDMEDTEIKTYHITPSQTLEIIYKLVYYGYNLEPKVIENFPIPNPTYTYTGPEIPKVFDMETETFLILDPKTELEHRLLNLSFVNSVSHENVFNTLYTFRQKFDSEEQINIINQLEGLNTQDQIEFINSTFFGRS